MKIIRYMGRDLIITINQNTLSGIDFSGYDLHRAIFENVDISYSIFNNVKDGRNCIFWKSDLSNAQLMNSKFVMAEFTEAILYQADLSNSILWHSDFIGSNLSEAILNGCDVRGAKFDYADLSGADMRCTNLQDAIFTRAIYDENTKWTVNFDPKMYGAIPT
jgi:uncharacterized protein YjbI with pentapeptide repeats